MVLISDSLFASGTSSALYVPQVLIASHSGCLNCSADKYTSLALVEFYPVPHVP
jgi:hypothetical protein